MWLQSYMDMIDDAWAAGDLDYPSHRVLAEAAQRLHHIQVRAYSAAAAPSVTPQKRLK